MTYYDVYHFIKANPHKCWSAKECAEFLQMSDHAIDRAFAKVIKNFASELSVYKDREHGYLTPRRIRYTGKSSLPCKCCDRDPIDLGEYL